MVGAVLFAMVDRYQDLIAWQTAELFKEDVFRLLDTSSTAKRDLQFCSDIRETVRSVSNNIVEGFLRFNPREYARFLSFALGSLGETESDIRDGIRLGYFKAADCEGAFRLARRCLTATVRLKRSQDRIRGPRPPKRSKRKNRPSPPDEM